MGLISVISGIIVLVDLPWGIYLFFISSGFCLYAVVNSAGYYAQRKTWFFVCMFAAIFTMTTVLCILNILNIL
ncbi:MAG: hypothetical protein ACTSO7_15890 [Candidatus Heimdallarchaeota archaeon]